MKRIFLTAAAILFAAPAFAADLPRAAEPVAPAYIAPVAFDWTGFYVGANIGYGFKGDFDDNADLGIDDANGFTGGVQAGYNYQFNPLVVGIEGEIDYSGISDRFEDVRGDLNWRGSVTPRLGFAIDRFLPYVKGGLAFGSVEVDTGDKDDNVLWGWTAGVGAEYAVTNNVSVRAEYNYTDLTTDSFTTAEAGTFDAGYKGSDVKVGVNYKF
jgi:outer membrane immunogenic protein